MPTLDEFRRYNWAQGKSDNELVLEVAHRTGQPPDLVAHDMGMDPSVFISNPTRNPLAAGLSAGVDDLQGLSWSALGAGADLVGADSLRDYSNNKAKDNNIEASFSGRPDLDRIENQSLSSALPYVGYQLGRQIPMVGAAIGTMLSPIPGDEAAVLGAMGRGMATAPRLVGGGGLKAGAGFAERRAALEAGTSSAQGAYRGTVGMYPVGVGSLYQESVDAGDPDAGGAFLGGLPYGAAEAFVPGVVKGLVRPGGGAFTGNFLSRTSKAGALAGTGEAGTELFQNEMEMGFNPTLTEEERFSRRLNSAAAGGIVGGSLGTLGGLQRRYTPDEIAQREQDIGGGSSGTPAAPNYNLVTEETEPLGSRVNRTFGLDAKSPTVDAGSSAFNQPSGVWVIDPETNHERELSNADWLDMQHRDVSGQEVSGTNVTSITDAYNNPVDASVEHTLPLPKTPGEAVAVIDLVRNEDQAGRPVLEGTPLHDAFMEANNVLAEQGLAYKPAKLAKQKVKVDTQAVSGAPLPHFNSAREAFIKSGGSAAAWAKFVGKNKLMDASPEVLAATLHDRATNPAISKTEPWIAAFEAMDGESIVNRLEEKQNEVRRQTGEGQPVREGQTGLVQGTQGQPVREGQEGATVQGQGQVIPKPTDDAPIEAKQQYMAQVKEQVSAGLTPNELKAVGLVMGERGSLVDSDERVTASLRAAEGAIESPRRPGQPASHEHIRKLVKTGLAKMYAAGAANGLDQDQVNTLMGMDDVMVQEMRNYSESEIAQIGGMSYRKADGPRVVRSESDDFNDTHGYEGASDEATVEPAAVEDAPLATSGTETQDTADGDTTDDSEDDTAYENDVDTLLDSRNADAAEFDWNEVGRQVGVPRFSHLPREVKAAWVYTYSDQLDVDDSFEGIAQAQAQFIQDLEAVHGQRKESTGSAAKPVAPRRESSDGESRPAVAQESSESESVASDREGEAAPVAAEPKKGNPLEARVAQLRPTLNEKQNASLDKMVKRYQSGDIDLERFVDELSALEARALPQGGDEVLHSKGETSEGTTAAGIRSALKKAFGKSDFSRIHIYQSVDEAVSDGALKSRGNGKERAWVQRNPATDQLEAYFIADNIKPGEELGIILHEVGAHFGMRNLLGVGNFTRLAMQVKKWAMLNDGSMEARIARRAMGRVKGAQEAGDDVDSGTVAEERIAYFVEEAVAEGVNPSATSPVGDVLRMIVKAMKVALRKIGLYRFNQLTARNIVDLAYGAAHIELASPSTSSEQKLESRGDTSWELKVDGDGFKNGDMSLEYAHKSRYLDDVVHYDVYDNNDQPVASVAVRLRDGKPVALINIEVEEQGGKWGEKIVRALVDTAPAEGLYVSDMVPSAVGFWKKMGVLPEQGGVWDHGNGTITGERYRNARPAAFNSTEDQAGSEAGPSTEGYSVEESDGEGYKFNSRRAAADKAWNSVANKLDAANRASGVLPKLLTLHQLKEVFGAKLKALAKHVELTDRMSMAQQRLMRDGHQVTQAWVKLHKATMQRLHRVMLDATMKGIHPDVPFNDKSNAHLTEENREAYEALKVTYNSLPPQAKEVYQAAKEHLAKTWEMRKTLFTDVVTAAYNKRIAEYEEAGDAKAVARMTKQRDQAIRDHNHQVDSIVGPYFPLLRFGDYVVVAKSDALRAAEADGSNEQVAKLRKSPSHYRVEVFQSLRAAEQHAAASNKPGFTTDAPFKGEEFSAHMRPMASDSLEQIAHTVSSQFDGKTATKIKDLMTDLYVSSLPEHSALQRQLKREGIDGASDDMLRAFGEVVEKDSFFLSRMQYSKDIADNMFKLKSEAREAGPEYQHVYDNLATRLTKDVEYQHTPVQNFLTKVSGVFHLGMAPAFLLTNLTQPWMITVPQLSGTYGMARTFGAVRNAFGDAARVIKAGKGGVFNLNDVNFDALEGEEADLLRYVADLGQLDITQNADMGLLAEGMPPKWYKGMKVFNWATHHIELHNRVTTALAAYRLAKSRGSDAQQARKLALDAVVKTQLDYSGTNAAYFMKQGVGPLGNMSKIVYQFRKYQQGMVYLLARNAALAFKGDTEAMKSLGYLMGTQLAFAGATGIPVIAPALAAAGMFFDEDDEDGDVEVQLRNYLADLMGEDAARAFWKGLPTMVGMDVSKNIGMGDLLNPTPMLRTKDVTDARTGKGALGAVATEVLGGTGGVAAAMIDAYLKGDVTPMLPRMFRNPVKAYNYATEGLSTRSGTQVFEADQFDGWDLVIRGIGFSTTKESEHYEAQSAKSNTVKAIQDRKSELLKEYATAHINGDDLADTNTKIAEYNADHPSARITYSSKLKAVQTRKKGSDGMDEAGVAFKKNEQSLRGVTRFAQ